MLAGPDAGIVGRGFMCGGGGDFALRLHGTEGEGVEGHTHTHTHTHMYVCVYIYIHTNNERLCKALHLPLCDLPLKK